MGFEKHNIDIAKRIDEINGNIEYTKLRESYKTQTVFEIIGKGRNETAHSALLSWLFCGKDLPIMGTESPLMGLFTILMHRIEEQHSEWYKNSYDTRYKDFKMAVRSRSLKISNVVSRTEVSVLELANIITALPKTFDNGTKISNKAELINQIDPGRKKGKKDSLDIYLTCDVCGIENVNHIEVIIENKIHSSENGAKAGKTEYERMPQTQRYYWACQRGKNDTDTLQFFVFLNARPSSELLLQENEKPDNKKNPKVWCTACDHFVSINYQDIYDSILSPLFDSDRLSAKSEFILTEYAKSMSIPVINSADSTEDEQIDLDSMTILATSPAERQKLLGFWRDNQDILLSALQVVEERDGLTPHKWTRAIINGNDNKLLTTKEVIQIIYDRFKNDREKRAEFWIKEAIKKEFNDLCAAKKRGKLDVIADNGDINKVRLKGAYSQLSTLAKIGKLYGSSTASISNSTDLAIQEKELRDVYDSFIRNYPEEIDILDLIQEAFNGFKYKVNKNEKSYNIIENHQVKESNILDSVYAAIAEENKLDKYKQDIREISFADDDDAKELLYRFWQRYQKLVMAALCVLSETNVISEEDKKGIRQVYDAISTSGRSYYKLEHNNKTYENLSMLGVVRKISQLLIWKGQRGQPTENDANSFFQKLLNDTKTTFVKKQENNSSTAYETLTKPKGEQEDSSFLMYKQKWTMNSNFGVLYDALSDRNNGHGFILERIQQAEE